MPTIENNSITIGSKISREFTRIITKFKRFGDKRSELIDTSKVNLKNVIVIPVDSPPPAPHIPIADWHRAALNILNIDTNDTSNFERNQTNNGNGSTRQNNDNFDPRAQ